MQKCKQCQEAFEITSTDQVFYTKMDVPAPDLCIFCRRQHLLVWRNQRTLYTRKCDATGKTIISIFAPNADYVVYDRDYWWSDKWDPLQYGMEFDFSKTFAEQYDALLHRVPMVAVFNATTENSLYCNHVTQLKDCYLCFGTYGGENLLYADMSIFDVDSTDVFETDHCTRAHELIQCKNCYNTNYAMLSERCNDSWFLFDCKDCNHCIGCMNLRNKEHYIFNQPYSKEEYEQLVQQMKLHTRSGIETVRKQFDELRKQAIHRFATLINSENSTGDSLTGAHNVRYSFALKDDIQNSAYCIHGGLKFVDAYDSYGVGAGLERCYFSIDSGVDGMELIGCVVVYGSQYAYYSYNCHSSFEIFGCTGLRNKKYCILNRQYTEAEYKELKKKIIAHMKETGEWGKLLPPSVSPFAYNETLSAEYTPLAKEEATRLGFKWQDHLPGTYGKETLKVTDVPQTIAETPDSIVNEVLACQQCGKNYKIIQSELDFYRKKNLPVPLFCPECRYHVRLAQRNPHRLWHRTCQCEIRSHEWHVAGTCTNAFQTPYAPERPEKVYCEPCYQREVV